MEQLADRDREAADGKSKDDNGNAGTNPGQERALVRQVIAGTGGILFGGVIADKCIAFLGLSGRVEKKG